MNSILGAAGREKREKKIVSENEFDPRNFFYETASKRERERSKRKRVVVKKSLTLSVYTRFPSSFR